jgi:hypothetical protein
MLLSLASTALCVGLVVFLLSFHIVIRRSLPLIVAKDLMTFKDTFITLSGYVEKYSEASPDERARLEHTKLHRALVRKGLIRKSTRAAPLRPWGL